MTTCPWLVAGTGRDATLFMQAVPGLVAKDGADGVYAAGLSEKRPAPDRIRFAAAVAALKAIHAGGQKGIPSRAEAERFFQEHEQEARTEPA